MWNSLIAILLLTGLGVARAQDTSPPHDGTFLIRMNEAEVSMHPTAGPNTVNNCVIVTANGHIHLELRRQEFFNGRATLVTYEGRLKPKELDSLRTIFETNSIRALPQVAMPTTPMLVDSYHGVTAEIPRPSGITEVGYFEWQGKAPENAANAGENWSQSAVAMKPLVDWFHSVKGMYQWKRVSNPRSGVCGESFD